MKSPPITITLLGSIPSGVDFVCFGLFLIFFYFFFSSCFSPLYRLAIVLIRVVVVFYSDHVCVVPSERRGSVCNDYDNHNNHNLHIIIPSSASHPRGSPLHRQPAKPASAQRSHGLSALRGFRSRP